MFYEADPTSAPTTKPTTTDDKVKATEEKAKSTTPVFVAPGQKDEKISAILEQAIVEANLPGPDYFEYRKSLDSLSTAPLTEEQKYTTSFVMIQAMGLDKEKLIASVDHYLSVLDKKEAEFKVGWEKQVELNVTAKQNQIAEIEESIAADGKELERLTKVIQEKRNAQNQLSIESSQNNITYQGQLASFNTTIKPIKDRVNSDKQKMENYIK